MIVPEWSHPLPGTEDTLGQWSGPRREAALAAVIAQLCPEERCDPSVRYALRWMITAELACLVSRQPAAVRLYGLLRAEFTRVVLPAVGMPRAIRDLPDLIAEGTDTR